MKLFFKILLVLFTSIIISFAIYSSILINQEKQNTEKDLITKIKYNEKVYFSSSSILLYELNKDVLTLLLNSIYMDREIVKVELKDLSETINIILDEKYSNNNDMEILKSKINLNYNNQDLGELHIFYTKKFINIHITNYKKNIFFFSLFLVVILFISLYFSIKRFTNSLALLTKATNIISSGNLSEKINIKSNDEIGLLSNQFELMRESLKQRIEINEKQSKELDKLNQNLEKEVEIRTIELQRTNEELEDSNEELQTMIYNLKQTQDKLIESEKMASLGSLVAGVAHEINTPVGIGLTGITHFIDEVNTLEKNYNSENMTEENFKDFIHNSKEISKLINSNLEKTAHLVSSFKQVAVDQTNDKKREINLSQYINEIIFSLSNITKKTNINIKLVCNENLNIITYPGSLSQVLTNLIINSIRHGFKDNEKGNISINIIEEENNYKIIYKDDGKGIKPENISKIFDPFFTTNRKNGGTGLGLNIIYNIITTTLEGNIKCVSEENKGVEFIIKFKADLKS